MISSMYLTHIPARVIRRILTKKQHSESKDRKSQEEARYQRVLTHYLLRPNEGTDAKSTNKQ